LSAVAISFNSSLLLCEKSVVYDSKVFRDTFRPKWKYHNIAIYTGHVILLV